jgi:hypothetical protein
MTTGGQGVHREVESEGFAEKYRAVVEGSHPAEEAKAFSSTHRTKVCADGTMQKTYV